MMNPLAVILGVLYGLAAAGGCYIVSMVASGLFARAFYRIYARVLIGICSMMLLVPLLRWMSPHPLAARLLLTAAHYATVAVLGYGVVRFNREYMKTVFLEKHLTAYFTFGTLVNAAVVTMVFLHIAATGGTSAAAGGSTVGPEHYGPFVMLLAAMIFHTDYHLKMATADGRRFGKFTFIGYAVAFIAIGISTLPYFGGALAALGVRDSLGSVELAFLENLSSAQTLLLAIIIFGALVWYLESIPPLYLLLLALCAEYHVLVTQWFIRAYGAASWGLASLPLFVGLSALAHYFTRVDRKRSARRARLEGVAAEALADFEPRLRFVVPFQVVTFGLGAALVAVTLWARFAPAIESPGWLSPGTWLGVTFAVYAGYFFIASVFEKNAALIYFGALLAILLASLAWESPAGPGTALALAVLGASFAGLSWLGQRFALKREYRTPLADSALASAMLALALVACRHILELGGAGPYRFQPVGVLDGAALFLAAFSFVACARQYRSRLPMYGTVLALVVAAPTLCAASSFLACLAAEIIRRRVPVERADVEDDRLALLDRIALPLRDRLPALYAAPLSAGALPLSLLGLAISTTLIVRGDLPISACVGVAVSALVLALITRTYPSPWLLVLAILSGYFAAHSTIHKFFFSQWSAADALPGHLAVAAALSLVGWTVATAYSAWCEFWLKRVAEAKEATIRRRHAFYSGLLHHVALAVATAALVVSTLVSLGLLEGGSPTLQPAAMLQLATALLLAVFFGLAGGVYRTKLGSYLSLTALAVASLSASGVFPIPEGTGSVLLAALALAMASLSAALWGRLGRSESAGRQKLFPSPWEQGPLPMAAVGLQIWLRPLAEFSLLFAGVSFARAVWLSVEGLEAGSTENPALATFGLTALTLLFCTRAYRLRELYVLAIMNALVAASAPLLWADLAAERPLAGMLAEQVSLAAVLAWVGWLIATAYSAGCNYRLRRASGPAAAAIRQRRAYYAGLLHHVTLLIASATLLIMFALPALADGQGDGMAEHCVFAGLTLAGFFALSGASYRSRLQSYLCLIALCFSCYGLAVIFGETGLRISPAASIGALALVFGLLAGLLLRFVRTAKERRQEFGAGLFPTAWEDAPLTLYATGAGLWAVPLAQASILLAFFAVGQTAVSWKDMPPVWSLAAICLASATLLLGTGTSRLGILNLLSQVIGDPEETEQDAAVRRAQADHLERIGLYVLGIVAVYVAVHATVQTMYLSDAELPVLISWHVLLAPGLSLVGWLIATGYTAWCRSRLARAAQEQQGAIQDHLVFYAGWLHHVVVAIATLALITLIIATLAEGVRSVPPIQLLNGLLLAVFFGLSGAVYRTKLLTYLALISLGLAAPDIAAVAALPWQPGGPGDAAGLALLGLGLIIAATGLWQAREQRLAVSPQVAILPAPWVRAPLPLCESSLRRLWAGPLAEISLVFAGLAILLAALRWDEAEWVPLLATFYLAAAIFILAARLYRTAVLTYFAAACLWTSLYPLLAAMFARAPYIHSGTAVASLSLILWGASFVVERRVRWLTQGRQEGTSTDPRIEDLVLVFEWPLGRCAGILAVMAVAHSLFFWRVSGWEASHGPLVAACVGGTLTLLLSARTMKITRQLTRAHAFVYLGSAAFACGSLAVAEGLLGFAGLGPVLGGVSLLFGIVGLALLESKAAAERAGKETGGLRRVYGEPLSHAAVGLPVFAVLLAVVNSLPAVIDSLVQLPDPKLLAQAEFRSLAATLLTASAVYLVSTRALRERHWLYPSLILGSLGVLAPLGISLSSGLFILTTVLFMNLLVVLARWMQSHPDHVGSLFGISGRGSERPFFQWPLVVTAVVVLGQGLVFVLTLLRVASPSLPYWPWALTPVLACGLFFHLFYLERRSVFAHLLIGSSLLGLLGAAAASKWLLVPDMAVAALGLAWGLVAGGLAGRRGERALEAIRLEMDAQERHRLSQAVAGWSLGLLMFAMMITVPIWAMRIQPDLPTTGLTVLLVAASFAIGAYLWQRVELVAAAAVLLLAGVCATLVFWEMSLDVLPVAGLCAIVLAAAYVAVSRRLMLRSAEAADADTFVSGTGRTLAWISVAFTALGAVGTIASVIVLEPSLPAALALWFIGVCWLYMAWHFKSEIQVYLAEAALACAFLYVRHRLLGVSWEPSVVAAFGLVGLSFLLYGLNILVARGAAGEAAVFVRPTYYSALLLPSALLAIAPWGAHEAQGALSLILFATASFYLVVGRRGQSLWAIYLAAALVNVALYIWIPTAQQMTGLYQVYVIPAALTVLVFAQLHRGDLNRQALTGIRFAASAVVLAVSTIEVFATDSLVSFVVVLFLSLLGVVFGVALRVRPFVYIGCAFLVLNVLGQLGLQIHNQGGIVRALILIAVGVTVMGLMIFFNIKREALRERYRAFLIDTRWE